MRNAMNSELLVRARKRLTGEAILASRFALVGVAATLIHVLVVWMLIAKHDVAVFTANIVAFLTAFGVSFSGNYFWTFGTPGRPGRAARRFFFISGTAFVANNALLGALTVMNYLPPDIAAVTAAAAIPPITYGASRLWGFAAHLPSS